MRFLDPVWKQFLDDWWLVGNGGKDLAIVYDPFLFFYEPPAIKSFSVQLCHFTCKIAVPWPRGLGFRV